MSKIFISKDPQDLHVELQTLLHNGILEAQSLIAFNAVSFVCPKPHDILFISSIRAAEFFFAQCQTSALIACAGSETAKKVAERFQKEVHYVAQLSAQPQIEAVRFNEWRNGRSVCFPSSQITIGTYAALLAEHEKIILPVYQTQYKTVYVKEKAIYVFSSPSNVTAFLQNNQIAANAKVVAWGTSTAQALSKMQISVAKILGEQQQTDLLNWLSKVL